MTDVGRDPLIAGLIDWYGLDLRGLTVYTEAAAGAYAWNAVLAAVAGASVLAETRDSSYASAEDAAARVMAIAEREGVGDRLQISIGRRREWLAAADIVTNSGFVRPIDWTVVSVMKPTAVVPLMWETWEWRAEELDLAACRDAGILVLGTDETSAQCDMRPFIGFLALKLLFSLGFDGGSVLLLASDDLLGRSVARALTANTVPYTWASPNGHADVSYAALASALAGQGRAIDHVIVAEHTCADRLVGPGALLDPSALPAPLKGASFGVMAGHVDEDSLVAAGTTFFPPRIAPFGYMSFQPYSLGRRPVLTLFSAGLRVGQAMARARLRGLDPAEAAAVALIESPAMDFTGPLAWR
jgi:hypothetical protein